MTNTIRVSCPKCDLVMLVPEAHAGKKVRCKRCKTVVPVESSSEEDETSEDELGAFDSDVWGQSPTSSLRSDPIVAPQLPPKSSEASRGGKATAEISVETCPFPGAILSHFLISNSQHGFVRSPNGLSQAVGFGYAGMFLLIGIALIVTSLRNKTDTAFILMSVLMMLLAGLFLTVLHFANHVCEQLADSLLQVPKFYVSSMGHLQLAALPFVLLAISMMIVTLPGAVADVVDMFSGLAGITLFGLLYGLFTPLLIILFGVSSVRLFLGVLLNPGKVGILVRADTSPAETTLAIAAAAARAPLTIVGPVHLSGVAAGFVAATATLAMAFGLQHISILVAFTFCSTWSFGALLWPIVSYVAYLLSMFGIELLQSFFTLTRNVAAIARQRREDDQ